MIEPTPIIVNGMPTTYGEMRGHALYTSQHGRNGVERGLAHAILFLIDEIEQRERATREHNTVE